MICKCELIMEATISDDESVIGDECHIISKEKNGPRHNPAYPQAKMNSYENLILLCRTHHKMIDDQSSTYSTDILKLMKTNHEKWVSESLNSKGEESKPVTVRRLKKNIPDFLVRISSGKELFNIIDGTSCAYHDHPELHDEYEVDLVGSFLQELIDWGDMLSDIGAGERVSLEYNFSKKLEELDQVGFLVFVNREKQYLEGGATKEPSRFDACHIKIVRKDDDSIIKVENEKLKEKIQQSN